MYKLTPRIRFMVFSDNCVGLVSFSRALSWDVEAFHRVSVFFFYIPDYYMAMSQKDWKETNSRISRCIGGGGGGGGGVKLANFSQKGP